MLTEAQRALLAARLRQGRAGVTAAAPASPVVELSGGTGRALFAFHAVGGTAYGYAALARELGAGFRVFGIEAPGLRAGSTPGTSLGDLATRYADAIRATAPDGPYELVGWSMGGVLAFETAYRLQDRGQRVAYLALLDAPYRTPPSYADTEEQLAALFVADVSRSLGPAGEAPAGSGVAEQLDWLARRLDDGTSAEVRAELDRRYAVFKAHTDVLAGYQPTVTVDADALLVSASDTPDSAPAWAGVLRGTVHTRYVDADHYGCLQPPGVGEIAEAIRADREGQADFEG